MVNTYWPYLVVAGCALLGGTAQVMLKKGADSFSIATLFSNYYLVVGILLYGVAFIGYVFALRFGKLSILYPLIALSYVFVLIGSRVFIHEPISMRQVMGSLVIIVGVWLVSGGSNG